MEKTGLNTEWLRVHGIESKAKKYEFMFRAKSDFSKRLPEEKSLRRLCGKYPIRFFVLSFHVKISIETLFEALRLSIVDYIAKQQPCCR